MDQLRRLSFPPSLISRQEKTCAVTTPETYGNDGRLTHSVDLHNGERVTKAEKIASEMSSAYWGKMSRRCEKSQKHRAVFE